MQDEVLEALALRQGHFKLESGHHGNVWLDLDQLFVYPGHARRFAAALGGQLAPYQVDAVCGPLVGGAFLAEAIAAELDVEFYYAERFIAAQREGLYPVHYRIPRNLRGRLEGKTVAVIDDVINAGSAVRSTMADLRACDARPTVVGALLVLGTAVPQFLSEQAIPLESLGYLPAGLWLPAACPLCASHIPLDDLSPDR